MNLRLVNEDRCTHCSTPRKWNLKLAAMVKQHQTIKDDGKITQVMQIVEHGAMWLEMS